MHAISIFLILILTSFIHGFAEESNLDSLKNLLKHQDLSTEEKASVYHAIGDYYNNTEGYEDAIKYYSLAVEDYRKQRKIGQLAHTLNALGKNFCFSGDDAK